MNSIRGTVTYAMDGTAAAGVTIRIEDSVHRTIEIDTDKRGQYSAIGFESGDIYIIPHKAGYYAAESTCHVRSGDRAEQDLMLYKIPQTVFSSPKIVTAVRSRQGLRPLPCRIEPDTIDRTIIE